MKLSRRKYCLNYSDTQYIPTNTHHCSTTPAYHTQHFPPLTPSRHPPRPHSTTFPIAPQSLSTTTTPPTTSTPSPNSEASNPTLPLQKR
ncbi:hypothetical protein E2C01_070396 [Portunus trituberculatus]|uniref:Uncharacterized protein n=1 Tax=Portunus trituberculatus TaxID=210409 RepID=A0A5B7I1G9_PORTR|nr:hypothetical protein [Portunus trituberculatus]